MKNDERHVLDRMNPNGKKPEEERGKGHMKRAISELMQSSHGRHFIRALNVGISQGELNTLLMDYHENK